MAETWDDLALVLAIVEHGGVMGAARALGVHHATVLRRLDAFEGRRGVVLFERRKTGYVPTPLGGHLAARAKAISVEVDQTYRELAGEDLRLSGTLRVTSTDFLAQSVLPPVLSAFRGRYPDVEIDLMVSARQENLGRRDADVAFRILSSPQQDLAGERLMELDYAIYGTPELAEIDPPDWPWVLDDQTLLHTKVQEWWQRDFGGGRVAMRVNSTMARAAAIRAGAGVGFLPTRLAGMNGDLVALREKPEWRLEVWFLVLAELSRLPRVQALRRVARQLLSDSA